MGDPKKSGRPGLALQLRTLPVRTQPRRRSPAAKHVPAMGRVSSVCARRGAGGIEPVFGIGIRFFWACCWEGYRRAPNREAGEENPRSSRGDLHLCNAIFCIPFHPGDLKATVIVAARELTFLSYQMRTRSGAARYSFSPGCTLKAAYQPSILRTVAARYSPGACGSVITSWRSAASRVFDPQFWPKAMKNC